MAVSRPTGKDCPAARRGRLLDQDPRCPRNKVGWKTMRILGGASRRKCGRPSSFPIPYLANIRPRKPPEAAHFYSTRTKLHGVVTWHNENEHQSPHTDCDQLGDRDRSMPKRKSVSRFAQGPRMAITNDTTCKRRGNLKMAVSCSVIGITFIASPQARARLRGGGSFWQRI